MRIFNAIVELDKEKLLHILVSNKLSVMEISGRIQYSWNSKTAKFDFDSMSNFKGGIFFDYFDIL